MSTQTPLEAIHEIHRLLESIPATNEGMDAEAILANIADKYMAVVTKIHRIVAPFVERTTPTDATQGALFDLPTPKPPSAIAEGR